jgi:competence protein ComEA
MKRAILMALVAAILTSSAAFAKAKTVTGVANLNTASVEQLALLPGVGESKAKSIVAFRKAHPFKATEEVTEVKGIGNKMYKRIAKHLAVRGDNTLREATPKK